MRHTTAWGTRSPTKGQYSSFPATPTLRQPLAPRWFPAPLQAPWQLTRCGGGLPERQADPPPSPLVPQNPYASTYHAPYEVTTHVSFLLNGFRLFLTSNNL